MLRFARPSPTLLHAMASTSRQLSSSRAAAAAADAEFTIVGCGVPGQSMGWYHAKQLMENAVPGCVVKNVVTRVGTDAKRDPGAHFHAFKACATSEHGVKFHQDLAAMGEALTAAAATAGASVGEEGQGQGQGHGAAEAAATAPRRVAVISSRTDDCPRLLREALSLSSSSDRSPSSSFFSHIYLEKPGASDVATLKKMASQAEESKVEVTMGYNKNVTRYVDSALTALARLKAKRDDGGNGVGFSVALARPG